MTQPATNPTPLSATLSGPILDKIATAIKSMPQEDQAIASALGPAAVRIILANADADILATYKRIVTTTGELDAIHAEMSLDEIATEKEGLAIRQRTLTQQSYDTQQILENIAEAVLSVGVKSALALVGL